MGKKVKKYARTQDFSKRKEEEERRKESPFSSIVLKEKTEDKKKTANNGNSSQRKKVSEVVQGYDPNASFADILANYERTGNPYAMPKKKASVSTPMSFGDILDKWEGKDKKKKKPEVEREKSSYKATRSFVDILSEYEGVPQASPVATKTVVDEEVEVVLEEKKTESSPLFKKESDDEVRSPEASWSIYGNNESFERKNDAEEKKPIVEESSREKKEDISPKSTYKATKDFGEILRGFYENHDDIPSSNIAEEIKNVETEIEDEDGSFFRKESDDESRSPEASWSIYGNNESFIRKVETLKGNAAEPAVPNEVKRKGYKGKKEFSTILDSFDAKKKEKAEVKTFEEIIKEKGDVPEKREYTISQLRTMLPQATLDLHGKTQEEAEAAVKDFLNDCRGHKIRKISIITGKGLHSEGGVGVLRDTVSRILDSDGGITERSSAPLQYGGAGALWVILKKEG